MVVDLSQLPHWLKRIKSWNHSKFQPIQAIFGPLIQKLCSDKSESVGSWGNRVIITKYHSINFQILETPCRQFLHNILVHYVEYVLNIGNIGKIYKKIGVTLYLHDPNTMISGE